jgi:heptose-I-phosphate ethanolaminephosphotransferase
LTVVLKQKFPKKFIILHLLGNHGNYSDRYPKSFDRFKTWDGIKMNEFNGEWHKMIKNTYDNAVLYNDSIIYEIIQKVKSLNQNSFVLYLSDHGEEVYDYRRFVGHSEANASIYMVEIPFILWVSDKYKIQNTEKVSHWPEYCNRKYQTDVMIHSMIDLLNLTSKEYLPKRSIFNPAFKFKQRIIVGNDFDELVKTKKSITD